MSHPSNTTRWRDSPVVPDRYDDLPSLVKVARNARGRIVFFDWGFSPVDLLGLRRAVYEWGSRYAGRYKSFDARVLAVINQALGDSSSVFVLNEPKNIPPPDAEVACTRVGDRFRLQGYAPFDIVFAYGSAGVGQSLPEHVYLSPAAQQTLVSAIEDLNWDIKLLQQEKFRAVRNALYGNALSYGVTDTSVDVRPHRDVPVHFFGPFSAEGVESCRCLFSDPLSAKTGVYLWTVNVGGEERVWYVGQTRRGFGQRMGEHLGGYLSGAYTTYDAEALSHGEHRAARIVGEQMWPQTLPAFLRDFEQLTPNLIALLRMMRFHLALWR
jgi:hypothetical protein